MKDADRYPIALAALARLETGAPTRPLAPFAVGPPVLRATPPRVRAARVDLARASGDAPDAPRDPGDPGELVDLMLVGADDADSGSHEVHLLFKSDVLGGLHLILVRQPDGMRARFLVEDSAARRAVAAHLDDLVAHLRGRGFTILSHEIVVQDAAGADP